MMIMLVKGISFVEKDAALVKMVEEYQKAKRLPSFIEAVRILLSNALSVNEIYK